MGRGYTLPVGWDLGRSQVGEATRITGEQARYGWDMKQAAWFGWLWFDQMLRGLLRGFLLSCRMI